MPLTRRALIYIGLAVALSSTCSGADSAAGLREMWLRGDFEGAQAYLQAHDLAGDSTEAYLSEAALAREQMGQYTEAAAAYKALFVVCKGDEQAQLDSKLGEWRNYKASGSQTWIEVAQADLAQRLASTAGQKSPQRRLALEMQAGLTFTRDGSWKIGEELRRGFPASKVILRDMKLRCDRLSRERDHTKRIAGAKQLLADYPGCYWRHMAYRLWLHSAWSKQDWDGLKAAAGKYLGEYPAEPEAQGAVSRYYFEADIEPEAGLVAAKLAVQLYEQELGLDGGIDSIRKACAARKPEVWPDYIQPGTSEALLDYFGSRFNVSRYWQRQGKYEAALAAVKPVIDANPYTTEDEQTLAPFLFAAGQASEGVKSPQAAYRHYVRCLMEGGAQGKYGLQAQARLTELNAALSQETVGKLVAQVLPAQLAGIPLPRFSDVSEAAGMPSQPVRRVAWGDVNVDGLPDLLIDGAHLLVNHGSMGFSEESTNWGLQAGSTGGLFADMDNDGDLDIAAFGGGRSSLKLLRNEGSSFSDVTAVSGLIPPKQACTGALWLDADNDGWLDLAACGHPQGLGNAPTTGHLAVYMNQGRARMSAPIAPSDLSGISVSSLCAMPIPDSGGLGLFCATRAPNEGYLLDLSAGQFTNHARALGCAGEFRDGAWGDTISAGVGDVNNDGLLDLFTCNLVNPADRFHFPPSQLLVAREGGMLLDARASLGLRAETSHTSPCFGDFNCDGLLDLFVTSSSESRSSWLYVNTGQGFVDCAYLAGAAVALTQGCASADYDNDGDLDLALCTSDGVRLLRNDSAPMNWLEVVCQGTVEPSQGAFSNGSAIGTLVRVRVGSTTMLRSIQGGTGIGCGDDLRLHFGLGPKSGICTVTVQFPSGYEYSRALHGGNTCLRVSETGGLESPVTDSPKRAGQPQSDVRDVGSEGQSPALPERPSGSSRN